METIAKIRRRHLVNKEDISAIARDLNMSRNTVRKYINAPPAEAVYRRTVQPTPKLGQHQALLESWLTTDLHLPKSQRRTAQRLFEGLQIEGYTGAYDSVQRFSKQWKHSHIKPSGKKAFVPMKFDAGDACQFDWSLEHVELGGVAQTVKLAHFRMAHSRRMLVVAYPNETQEMLFDAHNRAFTCFGGVPKRMLYDNPKTIVQDVLLGKERIFNSRFMAMVSHYLFEPVACTPASGWEKGQVENQVGNIREWLFTPRPKFNDLAALNVWLEMRCTELAARKHPTQTQSTILEVFSTEQGLLRQISATFDGYIEQMARVSNTCLVTVDRNRYSVPSEYAGCVVSVRRTADRIRVAIDGAEVASHARQFGRDHLTYDLWHYISVLEKKPGALRDGAPFKDLPAPIERVKDLILKQRKGDRAFVELLMATQAHGLEPLQVACELALGYGVFTASVVMNELRRLVSPSKPDFINLPDQLKLTTEPLADCSRYDQLRGIQYVN
jgi:transposase